MKTIASLLSGCLACVLAVTLGFYYVFDISQPAALISASNQQSERSFACYHTASAAPLDRQGKLNLLVWNIYKQSREGWSSALSMLARGRQLMLLQEASMTAPLASWLAEKGGFRYQVEAFKAFDIASGVLNLSPTPARSVCAFTQLEPWLRLPKSALYALYPLSNGEQLAVVNVHAVNFSYGTDEYQQQLDALIKRLAQHQGPMIVAGDFNSWSQARGAILAQMLSRLALIEVDYQPDNRLQFINGLPLDHVFYRGLLADKAEAPITDASDHNPILVSFRLKP